ncbi:MAG: MFS transporter [Sphaerochaeta sp.]|nr:MFS transporter [Sphaerochaeta sp.]
MNTIRQPRPLLTGFSVYKGLGSSIYALFAIRVINRFGDFVQLLLVLILTVRLGLSPKDAGIFVSASIIATMVGQMSIGMAADKWGKKPLLVLCQVMVSLSYLSCALLVVVRPNLIPYLILAASPFRGGTAPLTNTMVAEFSPQGRLSHSFSLLYLGTNIGVALGPMVASLLFARSLLLLFAISAVLLSLSTLLLLMTVPNRHAPERPSKEMQQARVHIPPILWLFFIFSALYTLTYGQNSFTLPLQFNSLYGDVLGASRYAKLMMVNAVVVLVCTTLLTAWTHRLGQLVSMAVALFLYVAGYLVYAFCSSFSLFLVATCIWTLGEILMATNSNVFLNVYAHERIRSQCNAWMHVFSSLGHSLAPALGGLVLLDTGYRQLWLLACGICFLLGCGYIALNKYLKS